MPQTPLTTLASYVTPAQVLAFADVRTLGQLCSDTGTSITPTALLTDPTLAALLLRACGALESAILVGDHYEPADVAALCAQPNSGGAQFIFGILADLTVGFAYWRRPDKGRPTVAFDNAMGMLEQLRQGARIFPTLEASQAGLLTDIVEEPPDVFNRFGSVVIASRYFGRRGEDFWRPPNR